MNFSLDIILKIILFLPIVAMSHIWLIDSNRVNFIRTVSLCYSYSIFLYSLLLYVYYRKDGLSCGNLFQYTFKINWIEFLNLNFTYGLDGISLFFLILTTFLIPLCILSSWESIKFRFKDFVLVLFFIEFLLLQAFSVLDLLLFYIYFEAVLIPMFAMIGIWGSRYRKIHASYQFFLYTFFGSVFMLLGIIYIYTNTGTTDYRFLLTKEFLPSIQVLLWFSFFASFAVKIPMLPVHIWLPEAHVEAPTAGSVLLAGILLKLGTYGLIRFSLPLFPFASRYFTPLILVISVVSIIYSSFTTLRQIDLKKIIAYTSVAHMNMVTIGIFSNTINGMEGALSLMLSHGLVSSGLFLCIGVLYDRYGTRLIKYYGGLINFMPLFGFCFLVFSLANMGFPGTSAFIGELLIFSGSFSINSLAAALSCTSIIFSSAYSVWLFNRVMYGPVNIRLNKFADLNSREFFYMSVLSLLVIFFGIYPNGILETMHTSCTVVLRSLEDWKFLNQNTHAFSTWVAYDFVNNHTNNAFMIELSQYSKSILPLHPNTNWVSFVESFRENPEPFEVTYYSYVTSPIYKEHLLLLEKYPHLCSTWDPYHIKILRNLGSNSQILDLPK